MPYRPEHHLKVSAAGLEQDFVMAAGYPGSTSRYATWPRSRTRSAGATRWVGLYNDWIDTIEAAAPEIGRG